MSQHCFQALLQVCCNFLKKNQEGECRNISLDLLFQGPAKKAGLKI
jgi:hypothetical protein